MIDDVHPGGETPAPEPVVAYKALRKDLRKLSRLLEKGASLRFNDAGFVDELEAVMARIPAGAELAEAVDQLHETARRIVEVEKATRRDQFGRVLSAFIRGARDRGTVAREYEASWRVGRLEIELQQERSCARALYNQETLIPWRAVSSAADLDELENSGCDLLDKVALPALDLIAVVNAAYDQAPQDGSHRRVTANDFLHEFRVELLRRELKEGGPGLKLRGAEFPLWALYYNLDLYRDLGEQVPNSERIVLETGDQQTVSLTLGIRLGGLRPEQDYQVFSYIGRPF